MLVGDSCDSTDDSEDCVDFRNKVCGVIRGLGCVISDSHFATPLH
jgi:hypothetical protein